jgi:hypothetical protein
MAVNYIISYLTQVITTPLSQENNSCRFPILLLFHDAVEQMQVGKCNTLEYKKINKFKLLNN